MLYLPPYLKYRYVGGDSGGFGGHRECGRGLGRQPFGRPPFEIVAGSSSRSAAPYSLEDSASSPSVDSPADPTPADCGLVGLLLHVSRGLRVAADDYDFTQGALRALARSKGDKLLGYLGGILSWFEADAGIEIIASRGAPADVPKAVSQIYRDLADKLDSLLVDVGRGLSGGCTGGWRSDVGRCGWCTCGWGNGRGLGLSCDGGRSNVGFNGGRSICDCRGFAAVMNAATEGLIAA